MKPKFKICSCEIIFIKPTNLNGGAENIINILYSYANKNLQLPSRLLVATNKISKSKDKSIIYNFLAYFRNSETLNLFRLGLNLFLEPSKFSSRLVITSHSHANLISAFFAIFRKDTIVICRESTVIFTRSDKSWLFRLVFKYLYLIIYRFVDLVICQTAFQRNYFRSHLKYLPTNKIVHISNPICDLHLQHRTREILSYDESLLYLLENIEITFIGSLTKNKDPFLFVNTVLSLVKLKFACKYIVNIIGNGPLYSQIICYVNSLKTPSVEWIIHGHLEKKLLSYYLSRSHVFLSLSHQEGFPNVILEAMQANVPFIGTTNSFHDTTLPINYFNDRFPSNIADLIHNYFYDSHNFCTNYSAYLSANHKASLFFDNIFKPLCK